MRSDAQPDVCAGAPFDAGSYTPIESRRPGLNDATFLLPRSPSSRTCRPEPEPNQAGGDKEAMSLRSFMDGTAEQKREALE